MWKLGVKRRGVTERKGKRSTGEKRKGPFGGARLPSLLPGSAGPWQHCRWFPCHIRLGRGAKGCVNRVFLTPHPDLDSPFFPSRINPLGAWEWSLLVPLLSVFCLGFTAIGFWSDEEERSGFYFMGGWAEMVPSSLFLLSSIISSIWLPCI